LSDDGHFHPGDRVKVRVQSRSDGYLVVIHVDPDKRVRVLFPLEPRADASTRHPPRMNASARDGFDFDLVEYGVSPHLAYGAPRYGGFGYPFFGYPVYGYPFYGPYGGTRLFIGLGFGNRFGHRFRPFRRFR
jgi:hypothetical protein